MIGVRMMMAAAGSSSGAGAGGLWTPAAIDTALWLDASDESSVSEVDYEIVQWSDKSGNARHATVPSGAGGPSYTPLPTGRVVFDGYNDALVTPAYLSGIVHTVYAVVYGRGEASGYFFVKGNIDSIDNSFSLEATYTGDPYNPVHVVKAIEHHSTGNMCDGTFNRSDISYAGRCSLSSMYNGGTENYLYENGNSIVRAFTASVSGTGSSTSIMHIGCIPVDEIYWTMNGSICELIHINGFHDEATRQKVEGYLAHKWDAIAGTAVMRQALPALHPYKTEPPMA